MLRRAAWVASILMCALCAALAALALPPRASEPHPGQAAVARALGVPASRVRLGACLSAPAWMQRAPFESLSQAACELLPSARYSTGTPGLGRVWVAERVGDRWSARMVVVR